MTQDELKNYALDKAEKFGFKKKDNEASSGNAVFRCNFDDPKGADFFAFIREEEPFSGAYKDFSLVIFPRKDTSVFFVSLGVGSLGFSADHYLSTLPGLRRSFLKLLDDDGKSFCKTSFSDIESKSFDLEEFIEEYHPEFKPVIEKYGSVLSVTRCLDSSKEEDLRVLDAWIATYAELRHWSPYKKHTDEIRKALNSIAPPKKIKDYNAVKDLLAKRRFVVLQGAPGTGKTFLANKIASEYKKDDNIVFEQFHAETSYSDNVCGLTPDLDNPGAFTMKKGALYKAIEKAQKAQPGERVLLIIDEINRANLSNVLGPVFYLFENDPDSRVAGIEIDGKLYTCLPSNLYVIATMNTADRSLAVVDFALRRRFAWYTMRPRVLTELDLSEDQFFDETLFKRFESIFIRYATDEELNLQPGQSFFIFDNKDIEASKRFKIEYELMPLIKEYLNEGYLSKAKEDFSNLFYELIQRQLFE